MMIILVYGFFICVLVNTGLTLTFGQTAQLRNTDHYNGGITKSIISNKISASTPLLIINN